MVEYEWNITICSTSAQYLQALFAPLGLNTECSWIFRTGHENADGINCLKAEINLLSIRRFLLLGYKKQSVNVV